MPYRSSREGHPGYNYLTPRSSTEYQTDSRISCLLGTEAHYKTGTVSFVMDSTSVKLCMDEPMEMESIMP